VTAVISLAVSGWYSDAGYWLLDASIILPIQHLVSRDQYRLLNTHYFFIRKELLMITFKEIRT